MRKAISKKFRFEVFKRDSFTCQYCGAHPPSIVLQVDHIHPVSLGGKNELDNLITSCQPCNIGKGANSLSSIPESLSDKSKRVSESESQIKGYQKVMEDRRKRVEIESSKIVLLMNPSAKSFNSEDFRSIKNFIEKLGFDEVYEAMEISLSKGFKDFARVFKYFCGVCINKKRELQK